MDAVFDFFSESLVPSSPVSSERPKFLSKGRSLGDLTSVGRTKVVSPHYPLTPLESKLKDIIVSIYGDNPTSAPLLLGNKPGTGFDNSSPQQDTVENDHEPHLSTTPVKREVLSIPKHLLSAKKPSTTQSEEMSSDLFATVPIFSADDIPLSDGFQKSDFSQSQPSSLVGQPTLGPTGVMHSASLPVDDHEAGVVAQNSSPQYTAFSPNDLPPDSVQIPLHSAVHSSSLQTAFSMPPNEKKLPGYPKRIDQVDSTIPPDLNIPELASASNLHEDKEDTFSQSSVNTSQFFRRQSSSASHPASVVGIVDIPKHVKAILPLQESQDVHVLEQQSTLPKLVNVPDTSLENSEPLSNFQPPAVSTPHILNQLTAVEIPFEKPHALDESTLTTHKPGSSFVHASSYIPPIASIHTGSKDLEQQIKQLVKEKAHLEGQLESVVLECQEALKDRAQLQSKLSKTEVQLKTAHKEMSVAKQVTKPAPLDPSEDGSDFAVEMNRLESALRKKRQEMAVMTRELQQLKKQVEDRSNQLISSKQDGEKKNAKIRELQATNCQLKEKMDETTDTVQELSGHIAKLQASLETTESAKKWLHDQLEEAIQSKLKLQDELRGFRVDSVGKTVKIDQLEQENTLLTQQMNELQNKILKDKKDLVNELESIEADVMSKETSYLETEARKNQLEQLLQLKNDQLEKIGAEVAQHQAKIAELENRALDDNNSSQLLAAQLKKLEDEKESLNNNLHQEKQVIETKDREIKELKNNKMSLQQRLQQAEATLISKEGTLQGLKDSSEIMRQELEGVKIARDYAETELASAQKSLAEMEAALELSESKVKEISRQLLSVMHKLQNTEKAMESLKARLRLKENELNEKSSELATLEDQSSGLVDQFRSLQSQFHSIADESGMGMAEKDKVINHLAKERKETESRLSALNSECRQLKESVKQLEVDNARLQGELESVAATTPKLSDIKQILQEKNAVEAQLGAERIDHQQEIIKFQAKVARLQTDLNDTKKESKKKVKKLQDELDKLQKEMDEMESNPGQAETETEDAKFEVSSLRTLLQNKKDELQSILQQQNAMKSENLDLKEQLKDERAQIAEVERASTLVASQLKQAALENERALNEQIQDLTIDNERLKGRLAGTDTAQKCLREHVNSLENSLAQKEAQTTELASKNALVLSEKDLEIEDFKCKNENLQDSIVDLKAELEKVLTEGLFNKQRADDLEKALADKELELTNMMEKDVDNQEVKALKEQLDEVEHQKEDLQAEIRTMKQQLALFRTSLECTKRELEEKTSLAEILEKKLQLTKNELFQSQEELEVLKNHIQSAGEKHKQESSDATFIPQSMGLDLTDSGPHDDAVSLGSTDEATEHLRDRNSLYKAQLDELRGRLVKARQEGQEAAENKKFGEIQSLQSQLGAKSKTLRTLQDCVSSLKDEMNMMQSQMSIHSSSLAHSYRSSREIESKIEHLHRSQSGSSSPYPRVSTPNH